MRIFKILVTSLLMFSLSQVASAQMDKVIKKAVKSKIKEFKKAKLQLTGTSLPIEAVLTKHFENVMVKGYEEQEATAENCPTINLCSRKVLVDACTYYAQRASSFIKGKVASEAGFDATAAPNTTEQDKFYAAYEQKVSANVSKVLKPSFSLKSKTKSGYTYITYFLIDQDGAKKARQEALSQAQEATNANVQWAESISDFINDTPPTN